MTDQTALRGTTSLVLASQSKRSRTHSLVFVPLVLSLTACMVGPDYVKPSLIVPKHWSNEPANQSTERPELARWWTRLNDPVLNNLIEAAVHSNLDVAAAKARIREARATYRQSEGQLLPTLGGTTVATRQRVAIPDNSQNSLTPQTSAQYRAGLDASWELDLFGKNQRNVEAAGYSIQAAEEQLRLAMLTLVGDVATNYVNARGYQARISLAERTARTQRNIAAITQSRFRAGSASAVELATATGEARNVEATVPSLQISFTEIVHRLSVLTGRAPGDLMDRIRHVSSVPKPKLPMPVGIPADILLSRPDVRFAERNLAQATAKIGRAEADRYPSISLAGNIATSGSSLGDLAKKSSIGWSFGPTLNVPLFRGGQLKAAVEMAEAQRDQSFIAYRISVLRALEDVENSLVGLHQERDRSGKLSSSVKAYQQAATLSRSLYQGGSADFLTVLDAERSLYNAEDALVQSRVAMTTSYIALNKALGGGWDGAINVSKPEVYDEPIKIKTVLGN